MSMSSTSIQCQKCRKYISPTIMDLMPSRYFWFISMDCNNCGHSNTIPWQISTGFTLLSALISYQVVMLVFNSLSIHVSSLIFAILFTVVMFCLFYALILVYLKRSATPFL